MIKKRSNSFRQSKTKIENELEASGRNITFTNDHEETKSGKVYNISSIVDVDYLDKLNEEKMQDKQGTYQLKELEEKMQSWDKYDKQVNDLRKEIRMTNNLDPKMAASHKVKFNMQKKVMQ